MTQKEIHKFLANTKVYVNGKSKKIQEKLFSFGYKWCTGSKEVSDTESPFLFIYYNMSLTRSNNMEHFSSNEHREISAEEILSIELTEPEYRPFKTQEECWNEMHKHPDFGWIKDEHKYVHINNIYKSEIELSPEEINNNDVLERCFVSFASIFEQDYTFTDGTPFGIKEE